MYSKKYNKSLGMFTSEAEHDEHSHCADAFRYLAMSDVIITQTPVAQSFEVSYDDFL
jgi:hypothetical protein